MYSGEAVAMINAYTDFLTKRYRTYEYGKISGIIVGKRGRRARDIFFCGRYRFDGYSNFIIFISLCVERARVNISSLDIVLPLGNENSTAKIPTHFPVHLLRADFVPLLTIISLWKYRFRRL